MHLHQLVNTIGQDLQRRYGEKVHKLTLHGGFSCPNRDGTIGRGGCTFCNVASFANEETQQKSIQEQLKDRAGDQACQEISRLFSGLHQHVCGSASAEIYVRTSSRRSGYCGAVWALGLIVCRMQCLSCSPIMCSKVTRFGLNWVYRRRTTRL